LAGGLARRATIIESYRQKKGPLLLIDAGKVFPNSQLNNPRLRSKLSLKIMDRMEYDALNMANNELSFGEKFLEDACADLSFPIVTSNLVDKISGHAWGRKYLIKEKGGITVAILGIMPANTSPRSRTSYSNLTVIPPEEALKTLLPEVKAKADLVVLLSSCGVDETICLVDQIAGIDLAIASGKKGFKGNSLDNPTPVMQAGGKRVGVFRITFSEDGSIANKENEFVFLGETVASDESVEKMIKEDLSEKALAKWQSEQKAKQEARKKGIEELQKLSPMEYIELIQQKNQLKK